MLIKLCLVFDEFWDQLAIEYKFVLFAQKYVYAIGKLTHCLHASFDM